MEIEKERKNEIRLEKIYNQESVVRRLGFSEGVYFHPSVIQEIKDKFHKMYLEVVEIIAETGRDTKYRNIMTLEKAQNILNVKVTKNIINPVVNPGGWANRKKKKKEQEPYVDKPENTPHKMNEQKMKLLKGKVLDTSLISKNKKTNVFIPTNIKKRPYKKSRKQIEKEEYIKNINQATPSKYYPFLKERSLDFHHKLQDLTIHDLKIPTYIKNQENQDNDTPITSGKSISRKIHFYTNPEFENYFILAPTTFFKAIRRDARGFGKIQFTRESIFLIQLVTEIYIRDYLKVLKIINHQIFINENKRTSSISKTSLGIYKKLKEKKRLV